MESPLVECETWFTNNAQSYLTTQRAIGRVVGYDTEGLTPAEEGKAGSLSRRRIAFDDCGDTLVWRSNGLATADRIQVGNETGTFLGSLREDTQLTASTIYFFRVRQQSDTGRWSAWSSWHQPVRTEPEK